MKFLAEVKIMPLKDLLDPQGKAVLGGLQLLGIKSVSDIRVGKHISLEIEADNKESALEITTEAAKKLLANPVMEVYEIAIS
jgi:phosphoribosylformylglycinamidine synthase subunit PurS